MTAEAKVITVWATSTQVLQFSEEHAIRLLANLTQALGRHTHAADGCKDDSCPCRTRKKVEPV